MYILDDMTTDELDISAPEVSEDEFRRRARALVEDYTKTTTDAVPNLGSVLSLKDKDGTNVTVTSMAGSLFLQWDKEIDRNRGERKVFLSESPLNSGSFNLRLDTNREVLEFVEGKVAELLRPLKQIQAARASGRSQG